MTDFKLYGRCFAGKHNAFFIRKRKVKIAAIAEPITSKELLCSSCFKKIVKAQQGGVLN